MTRKRYLYANGEVIYAQEGDSVILDERDHSIDPHYMVMPDIQPYKSMIDGRIINSRSIHRIHLRDHGCEEIGNDSSLTRKQQPIQSPPGLKEEIIRAARKHWKDI